MVKGMGERRGVKGAKELNKGRNRIRQGTK
jgi:hypothetical protein